MATPLEITRTYPVVGPNVVAFAKVNAAGATSAGVRIGENQISLVQARNYAAALTAACDGLEDLAAQASALYQRG
jgi:hypothetical protein